MAQRKSCAVEMMPSEEAAVGVADHPEGRNPASHSGHLYFSGTVKEAIAACRSQQTFIVVFLKGEDSESLLADETIHRSLEKQNIKCVALRLHDNLDDSDQEAGAYQGAKNFREIFPEIRQLPFVMTLGPDGQTLNTLKGLEVAAHASEIMKTAANLYPGSSLSDATATRIEPSSKTVEASHTSAWVESPASSSVSTSESGPRGVPTASKLFPRNPPPLIETPSSSDASAINLQPKAAANAFLTKARPWGSTGSTFPDTHLGDVGSALIAASQQAAQTAAFHTRNAAWKQAVSAKAKQNQPVRPPAALALDSSTGSQSPPPAALAFNSGTRPRGVDWNKYFSPLPDPALQMQPMSPLSTINMHNSIPSNAPLQPGVELWGEGPPGETLPHSLGHTATQAVGSRDSAAPTISLGSHPQYDELLSQSHQPASPRLSAYERLQQVTAQIPSMAPSESQAVTEPLNDRQSIASVQQPVLGKADRSGGQPSSFSPVVERFSTGNRIEVDLPQGDSSQDSRPRSPEAESVMPPEALSSRKILARPQVLEFSHGEHDGIKSNPAQVKTALDEAKAKELVEPSAVIDATSSPRDAEPKTSPFGDPSSQAGDQTEAIQGLRAALQHNLAALEDSTTSAIDYQPLEEDQGEVSSALDKDIVSFGSLAEALPEQLPNDTPPRDVLQGQATETREESHELGDHDETTGHQESRAWYPDRIEILYEEEDPSPVEVEPLLGDVNTAGAGSSDSQPVFDGAYEDEDEIVESHINKAFDDFQASNPSVAAALYSEQDLATGQGYSMLEPGKPAFSTTAAFSDNALPTLRISGTFQGLSTTGEPHQTVPSAHHRNPLPENAVSDLVQEELSQPGPATEPTINSGSVAPFPEETRSESSRQTKNSGPSAFSSTPIDTDSKPAVGSAVESNIAETPSQAGQSIEPQLPDEQIKPREQGYSMIATDEPGQAASLTEHASPLTETGHTPHLSHEEQPLLESSPVTGHKGPSGSLADALDSLKGSSRDVTDNGSLASGSENLANRTREPLSEGKDREAKALEFPGNQTEFSHENYSKLEPGKPAFSTNADFSIGKIPDSVLAGRSSRGLDTIDEPCHEAPPAHHRGSLVETAFNPDLDQEGEPLLKDPQSDPAASTDTVASVLDQAKPGRATHADRSGIHAASSDTSADATGKTFPTNVDEKIEISGNTQPEALENPQKQTTSISDTYGKLEPGKPAFSTNADFSISNAPDSLQAGSRSRGIETIDAPHQVAPPAHHRGPLTETAFTSDLSQEEEPLLKGPESNSAVSSGTVASVLNRSRDNGADHGASNAASNLADPAGRPAGLREEARSMPEQEADVMAEQTSNARSMPSVELADVRESSENPSDLRPSTYERIRDAATNLVSNTMPSAAGEHTSAHVEKPRLDHNELADSSMPVTVDGSGPSTLERIRDAATNLLSNSTAGTTGESSSVSTERPKTDRSEVAHCSMPVAADDDGPSTLKRIRVAASNFVSNAMPTATVNNKSASNEKPRADHDEVADSRKPVALDDNASSALGEPGAAGPQSVSNTMPATTGGSSSASADRPGIVHEEVTESPRTEANKLAESGMLLVEERPSTLERIRDVASNLVSSAIPEAIGQNKPAPAEEPSKDSHSVAASRMPKNGEGDGPTTMERIEDAASNLAGSVMPSAPEENGSTPIVKTRDGPTDIAAFNKPAAVGDMGPTTMERIKVAASNLASSILPSTAEENGSTPAVKARDGTPDVTASSKPVAVDDTGPTTIERIEDAAGSFASSVIPSAPEENSITPIVKARNGTTERLDSNKSVAVEDTGPTTMARIKDVASQLVSGVMPSAMEEDGSIPVVKARDGSTHIAESSMPSSKGAETIEGGNNLRTEHNMSAENARDENVRGAVSNPADDSKALADTTAPAGSRTIFAEASSSLAEKARDEASDLAHKEALAFSERFGPSQGSGALEVQQEVNPAAAAAALRAKQDVHPEITTSDPRGSGPAENFPAEVHDSGIHIAEDIPPKQSVAVGPSAEGETVIEGSRENHESLPSNNSLPQDNAPVRTGELAEAQEGQVASASPESDEVQYRSPASAHIAFRLTNGDTLRSVFPAETELRSVVAYINYNRTDGRGPYLLRTPLPYRLLDSSQYDYTLEELELCPRTVLVLQPADQTSSLALGRRGVFGGLNDLSGQQITQTQSNQSIFEPSEERTASAYRGGQVVRGPDNRINRQANGRDDDSEDNKYYNGNSTEFKGDK